MNTDVPCDICGGFHAGLPCPGQYQHPSTHGPTAPLPVPVMPEDVRRQIEEILAEWAAPPDYPQRPQLCPCPICNGAGSVPAYGTAAFDPCPYCLGARAVLVYPGGTVRPARVTP